MEKFNFKPFDKVLVRDSHIEHWEISFYSRYIGEHNEFPYKCTGSSYKYCIPYNDETAHLLGTTDDYVEPYVPKDGDFVVSKDRDSVFIYKDSNDDKNLFYAQVELTDDKDIYIGDGELHYGYKDDTTFSPATEEEKQLLLSKLAEIGKKWNPEKKCIEDAWTPQDGDFVTYTYPNGGKYVAIYYCKESESIDCFYVDLCLKNEIEGLANRTTYKNRFERDYIERRPSTDSEKQLLLDALHKEGNDWDESKKEIVEYKWRPIEGETYWFVNSSGESSCTSMRYQLAIDKDKFDIGNCFRTEAEAQAMADKFKELLKGGKE